MKKTELIQQISEQTGVPKGKIKKVLDAAFASMSEEISNGESASIPGLGRLVIKERAASSKTNPETGETVEVPAKKVVAFRPAKPMKQKLAAQ